MENEVFYLEDIRRSLLSLPELDKVLSVSNDRQERGIAGWNTARKHLHELLEMRILFGSSGGGQFYHPAAAFKESHFQFIFQLFYSCTQRPLGHIELLSSAAEVQFLCYGHKIAQRKEFH